MPPEQNKMIYVWNTNTRTYVFYACIIILQHRIVFHNFFSHCSDFGLRGVSLHLALACSQKGHHTCDCISHQSASQFFWHDACLFPAGAGQLQVTLSALLQLTVGVHNIFRRTGELQDFQLAYISISSWRACCNYPGWRSCFRFVVKDGLPGLGWENKNVKYC